jgi:hypothetical protein
VHLDLREALILTFLPNSKTIGSISHPSQEDNTTGSVPQ